MGDGALAGFGRQNRCGFLGGVHQVPSIQYPDTHAGLQLRRRRSAIECMPWRLNSRRRSACSCRWRLGARRWGVQLAWSLLSVRLPLEPDPAVCSVCGGRRREGRTGQVFIGLLAPVRLAV